MKRRRNAAQVEATIDRKTRSYRAGGPRSSFRDWAAEEADPAPQVAAAALAPKVFSPGDAAYWHIHLFERRRRLMEDWAEYIAGEG